MNVTQLNKPDSSVSGVDGLREREYVFLARALCFTLPQIGLLLLFAPISILAGIYAKYFGLSLAELAGIILLARIFDAVTDPLVGYWSDRVKERTGSRKAFVFVGGLMLVPLSYFLYVPVGVEAGAEEGGVSLLYFASLYIAFYWAYTLFQVPYFAWANEFTNGGPEKIQVFTTMTIMASLGTLIFYSVPFLSYFSTTDVTPEVLKLTTALGVVLFGIGLVVALIYVPDGPVVNADRGTRVVFRRELFELYTSLVANKPFLLYIAIAIAAGLGMGLWLGLFFTFVDSYLQQGAVYAKISILGVLIALVAMPFWFKVVMRIGKLATWLVYSGCIALFFLSLGFLQAGVGEAFIIGLYIFYLSVSAVSGIIAGPILCDIIDYGRLKKESANSGLMFALQGLLMKLPMAVGTTLSLAIAGWLGYDATFVGGQTSSAEFGMRLGVSWLPAFFMFLSIFLIARMPLSKRRMEIIRKRLTKRTDSSKVSPAYP